MKLKKLQEELLPWQKHNFPDRPSWQPLLGVVEEIGELAHSHLKKEQNIRLTEDHDTKAKDAVGDIIVYLADYCNARGWDMEEILLNVWSEVKQRDWKKDNKTGSVF